MHVRTLPRFLTPVGVAALIALSLGALPMSLTGQTPGVQEEAEWSDDGMETLARAYLALTEVRDELHRELADTHQAGERQEVRRRADERMAAVLAEKGMSAEDYERLTFLVSADDDIREAFEDILQRLRGEGGG